MYRYYNANPQESRVGDCTVRAISKALGQSWDETYIGLCVTGLEQCDMPSANAVWGRYLKRHGYTRRALPDTCPDCYTVEAFTQEHPEGTFILALPSHVIAVIDGDYFDTWDSGGETPIYYWRKDD